MTDAFRGVELIRSVAAHARFGAVTDGGGARGQGEHDALKRNLETLGVNTSFLVEWELENYWLLDDEFAHYVITEVAAHRSEESGNSVSPPSLEDVSSELAAARAAASKTKPAKLKGSQVLSDMCTKRHFEYDKVEGARAAARRLLSNATGPAYTELCKHLQEALLRSPL
jgi:hypothetical protein